MTSRRSVCDQSVSWMNLLEKRRNFARINFEAAHHWNQIVVGVRNVRFTEKSVSLCKSQVKFLLFLAVRGSESALWAFRPEPSAGQAHRLHFGGHSSAGPIRHTGLACPSSPVQWHRSISYRTERNCRLTNRVKITNTHNQNYNDQCPEDVSPFKVDEKIRGRQEPTAATIIRWHGIWTELSRTSSLVNSQFISIWASPQFIKPQKIQIMRSSF